VGHIVTTVLYNGLDTVSSLLEVTKANYCNYGNEASCLKFNLASLEIEAEILYTEL
jgi:hypothetical protein